MERGLRLSLFDFLNQVNVLGDQLTEVGHLLQQLGEEVDWVRVVRLQVEVQSLQDAVLTLLHLLHVYQPRAICEEKKKPEATQIELEEHTVLLFQNESGKEFETEMRCERGTLSDSIWSLMIKIWLYHWNAEKQAFIISICHMVNYLKNRVGRVWQLACKCLNLQMRHTAWINF